MTNFISIVTVESYLVSMLFWCGVDMTSTSMIVLACRTTILCRIKQSQSEQGLCKCVSLYKITELNKHILQGTVVGQQLLQDP